MCYVLSYLVYVFVHIRKYIWSARSKVLGSAGFGCQCARGRSIRENIYRHVPISALEFGLARRIPLSRTTSACSLSASSLYMVLTHGPLLFLPLSATASISTVNRHRASLKLFGSRMSVLMAFTAEDLPAQGHKFSR